MPEKHDVEPNGSGTEPPPADREPPGSDPVLWYGSASDEDKLAGLRRGVARRPGRSGQSRRELFQTTWRSQDPLMGTVPDAMADAWRDARAVVPSVVALILSGDARRRLEEVGLTGGQARLQDFGLAPRQTVTSGLLCRLGCRRESQAGARRASAWPAQSIQAPDGQVSSCPQTRDGKICKGAWVCRRNTRKPCVRDPDRRALQGVQAADGEARRRTRPRTSRQTRADDRRQWSCRTKGRRGGVTHPRLPTAHCSSPIRVSALGFQRVTVRPLFLLVERHLPMLLRGNTPTVALP